MEGEIRKSPNATLEQTVAYLQVSTRLVSEYQSKGLLEVRYLGRRRFFTWASVEKLAKTGAK